MDKERISTGFQTYSLAHRIEIFDEVSSTNSIAKELASQSDSDGLIIIAEKQTSGRGREQRFWHSPRGGLYLSIVITPSPNVKSYALYGLMMACVLHEAIKSMTGLQPHLKWPNDLLVNDQKLCGILSELVSDEQGNAIRVVLGVGVNVNIRTKDFPIDLRGITTSILDETSSITQIEDLIVAIVSRLDRWLESDPALSKVQNVYMKLCKTLASKVCVDMKEKRICGMAKEINEYGMLLIEDESGHHHEISAGDVRYVRSE